MLITFSFAFDPEKKVGTFAGNCDALLALQILQQLVYSTMQAKVKAEAQETLNKGKEGGKDAI